MNYDKILKEVREYYDKKISKYGDTARGVDWNSEEGQSLRFIQLLKIVRDTTNFSIFDLGCGYGALVSFLLKNYSDFNYFGCDISAQMIDLATKKYVGKKNIHFNHGIKAVKPVEYSIASGLFNVKNNASNDEWKSYMLSTIEILNNTSLKGFSFNCLTKYSDTDKKKEYLYYCDPCWLFDLCKEKYSRNVSLLHDYDLYEFTILVKK